MKTNILQETRFQVCSSVICKIVIFLKLPLIKTNKTSHWFFILNILIDTLPQLFIYLVINI